MTLSVFGFLFGISTSTSAGDYTQGAACTLSPTNLSPGETTQTTFAAPAGASGGYQITATTLDGTVCTLTATVLTPGQPHSVTNTGLADTGLNLALIPWLAGGIILIGAAAVFYTRLLTANPADTNR